MGMHLWKVCMDIGDNMDMGHDLALANEVGLTHDLNSNSWVQWSRLAHVQTSKTQYKTNKMRILYRINLYNI